MYAVHAHTSVTHKHQRLHGKWPCNGHIDNVLSCLSILCIELMPKEQEKMLMVGAQVRFEVWGLVTITWVKTG